MLEGKINGEEFKLNFINEKTELQTNNEFIKYIIGASREVTVYDPYKGTIDADIQKNEWEAWLILNKLSSDGAIELDLINTDIKYEPEYQELFNEN